MTAQETIALLEKAQAVAHIGSWARELGAPGRLTWSCETYRIFGVSPEDFPGALTGFFPFVHPDDLEPVMAAANAAQDEGAPYDIEYRIARADGSVRRVHERADVIRDAAGTPVRMVGTVQDITEKRLLEEQLRHLQKLEAVGRLAGGIAHDLNNSLTAIIGFTELALGALAGSHPARADVQEIRRAAARAESVTRQLLAFSRKQMLEPRVFSLGDSVGHLRRTVEHILGPSVTFTTDAAIDAPSIFGDAGQIEQAILNIVANARDAMSAGGSLSLSVRETTVDAAFAGEHVPMSPGRYVELRVADTGCGMDAETRARIFEPFFTTKDVGKGTGLGLAMVYGTVRQSGGYIFVESEPGQGATFHLFFPPAPDGAVIPVTPMPAGTQRAATILVVEDEAAVRTIVVTSLRRKGHRVLHAASADEALEIARAQTTPIDLLLTDATMPGKSGIELARLLAPARPEMLIVVMSGYTEESLALRDAGVPAVLLPKPFTPTELQRAIGELLAGRRVEV